MGDSWMDSAYWPAIWQPLLQRYGVQLVWEVGKEVLKYPPTFCEESQSARRVAAVLIERSKHQQAN